MGQHHHHRRRPLSQWVQETPAFMPLCLVLAWIAVLAIVTA